MEGDHRVRTDYFELPASSEAIGLLLRQFAGKRIAVVSGLEPDEPIWSLRGHDVFAVDTIKVWLEDASARWLDREGLSAARAAGVAADIAALERWQADHANLVKVPD